MGSQAEDDRFLKHIAKVITDKRIARSWTKAKLSRKTYLSRPLIVSYEKGERNIPVLSLKYIADALDFPMTDYFIDLYSHDDKGESGPDSKDIRHLSIWKKDKTQPGSIPSINMRTSIKFVRMNGKLLIIMSPVDSREKLHNPFRNLLRTLGNRFLCHGNRSETSCRHPNDRRAKAMR